MSVLVTDVLTAAEIDETLEIGRRRTSESRNDRATYGYKGDPNNPLDVETDAQAALAERFVAAYLELPWTGRERCSDVDVGRAGQVRWTARPSGCLIAHDEDKGAWLALCVESAPLMRFVGVIAKSDAVLKRYWRAGVRHPAYFVPQDKLRAVG